MSGLLIKGISKRYLNGVNAVSNFNLELANGELVVLAGAKGAGKSTILKIICGLEKSDEGEIYIDSQGSMDICAKNRNVAIIFPCHELYPQNTVYENLEFSLRLMKCPRSQMKEKIMKVARELELVDFLDKIPEELTPAEQFAAILARCIIKNPKIILIDESFSDVDNEKREAFRQAVVTLNKKFKHTIIVATSSPDAALAMGARTVILKNGYIQQVDNVENIYKNPANIYVAQFMNHFNMTTIEAYPAEGENNTFELVFDKGAVKVPINDVLNKKLANYIGREVTAGIRHCHLIQNKHDNGHFKGRIDEIKIVDGKRVGFFKSKLFDAKLLVDDSVKEDDKMSLSLTNEGIFVFDKDTGKTII